MIPRISGVRRLFGLAVILAAGPLFGASPNRTENVVLVTTDGLRRQEVFGGIDKSLMHAEKAGMKNARRLREKLWHDSAVERRKRLLPFFWGGAGMHFTPGYPISCGWLIRRPRTCCTISE